eukprot:CAMPEP_0202442214 /NCGR_PEP_ID=MMETSP1360-20130828/1676_1 /ASSEMBLY_ACC=CAM_ASM_000848 /TAXON_ID=515479 /ORGANISM="Licmophora paradoxa, Strain CCMP2313" /LENGTH=632 /DNA_ID=CAMNT_0049057513 /DNA_START=45 /DNA_END=1943 /DNA_ORIENTATION=-
MLPIISPHKLQQLLLLLPFLLLPTAIAIDDFIGNPGEYPSCSVCGEGSRVGNEAASVEFVTGNPINCGDLQQGGLDGVIQPYYCNLVRGLLDPCECETIESTPSPIEPSPVTTAVPSIAGTSQDLSGFIGEPGEYTSCVVCGAGKHVGNPDAFVVFFDGGEPTKCSDLEQGGLDGIIKPEYCSAVSVLILECECQDGPTTPKAVDTPTPVPVPTTPLTVPAQPCSVCGPGSAITLPDAVIEFTGYDPVTCGLLQMGGVTGQLSPDQCVMLPDLIWDACGCSITSCSVCGFGREVTLPDVILEFEGITELTCGALQEAGYKGQVTLDQCHTTADLIEGPCGCAPVSCSICGEDSEVTLPDALVQFPGMDPISCSVLENGGLSGQINSDQCEKLPGLISDACGCSQISSSSLTVETRPSTLPTHPTCVICGANRMVTKPDVTLQFPDKDTPVACAALETDGKNGLIDPEQCEELTESIETECGCEDMASASPSDSPMTIPPAVFHPSCSICGENKVVTKKDAELQFPKQREPIACGDLEEAGEGGVLAPSECHELAKLIGDVCGCENDTTMDRTANFSDAPIVSPSEYPTVSPYSSSPSDSLVPSSEPKEGKRGKRRHLRQQHRFTKSKWSEAI